MREERTLEHEKWVSTEPLLCPCGYSCDLSNICTLEMFQLRELRAGIIPVRTQSGKIKGGNWRQFRTTIGQ